MSCKYCGFTGTNDQMMDHAGEMCGMVEPPEQIAQRDERIKELEQALREVANKGDGWSKSIAEEALSRT